MRPFLAALFGLIAPAAPPDTALNGQQAMPRPKGAYTYRTSMVASAYCLRGTTAMGTIVAPGTIAVDPRRIRLGTHLHVAGYGHGRALDTGSAIKGNRIDLWMGSCTRALRWGMRRVTVTVYG